MLKRTTDSFRHLSYTCVFWVGATHSPVTAPSMLSYHEPVVVSQQRCPIFAVRQFQQLRIQKFQIIPVLLVAGPEVSLRLGKEDEHLGYGLLGVIRPECVVLHQTCG